MVVNALDRLSISCFVPQILDMRFQISVTSEHVADYGLVPSSELGHYAAKYKKKERKKERRRIPVKYKSTDNYVGWPSN